MTSWRPIETAPMDGGMIVLCRATDANDQPITGDEWDLFVQVAAWSDLDGDWVVRLGLGHGSRLRFEPTHWMPLPPHPLASVSPEGE